MSTIHNTCSYGDCENPVRNALFLRKEVPEHATSDFDTHSFCSWTCANASNKIDLSTCLTFDCHNTVAHQSSTATHDSSKFDTAKYCSINCARLHYRQDSDKAELPITTCIICYDDKELDFYIHKVQPQIYDVRGYPKTNVAIPPFCMEHIMPEHNDFESGVCMGCIDMFIEEHAMTHGTQRVTCVLSSIITHPDDDTAHGDWRLYSQNFLSKNRYEEYDEEAFLSWLSNYPAWDCPADCSTPIFVVDPSQTPGYPQVHCPGCRRRYCAECHVLWHEEVTCHQYRVEHPKILEREEADVLVSLALRGARRCPRCRFPIDREGGCKYMLCPRRRCKAIFDWSEAERLVPIKDEDEQKQLDHLETGLTQAHPTDYASEGGGMDAPSYTATLPARPGFNFNEASAIFVKPPGKSDPHAHTAPATSGHNSTDDQTERPNFDPDGHASPDLEAQAIDHDNGRNHAGTATPPEICEMDRLIAQRESRIASAAERLVDRALGLTEQPEVPQA